MGCLSAVAFDAGRVFSTAPQPRAAGGRRAKRLARALLLVIAGTAGGAAALLPEPARAQCAPASPCVTAPVNLGTLGGSFDTQAAGVNSDGSVVVGYSYVPGNLTHAFRWTSGGMVDLGTLGGLHSFANGVSSDGSVVVGYSDVTGNAAQHAYRWTSGGGMVDLGVLTGGVYSSANAVNADGSVVVGFSYLNVLSAQHAFRWTSGSGMVDLGTLGGTYASANGVNADGSVVVGQSNTTGNLATHAFRWTSGGGMVDLGSLGGDFSIAYGVNADGSVVVGFGDLTGGAVIHAFRWTSGGMADLGSLGGDYAAANGVNASGSVVVGESYLAGNAVIHAFRWTAATGIRDLNTLLASAGVNMSGIELTSAKGVSGNGQFIVGYGAFSGDVRAFIVRYDDGPDAAGPTTDGPAATVGLTTPQAQQDSVDGLARQHAGLMAQQHGLAAPLLGANQPMGTGSEAGAYAAGGSASAGGTGRFSNGQGLSLLAGAAWAREAYPNADLKNSFMAAAAVQYVHDGFGAVRPFAEAGGWIAPDASLSFTREYMNGAGTARGTGATKGTLSYAYGRAGVLLFTNADSQLVLSGEYGRERLTTAGYEESTTANPFNAIVSGGSDRMDIVKARIAASHPFTGALDATLWAAQAWGFRRTVDFTATVAGLGTLTPAAPGDAQWTEYGARVGYKVMQAATLDVFLNGVSGGGATGSRVHAGAGLRFRF